MLGRVSKLDDYEIKRILECLGCKYFRQCNQSVKNPEDNPDGTCKTKMIFEEGIVPYE